MSAFERPIKSLLQTVSEIGLAISASQELSRAARENSAKAKSRHPLAFL
ncbi:hypothetical protein ACQQ2Q_01955 [Agrobacterium sp. ES01]